MSAATEYTDQEIVDFYNSGLSSRKIVDKTGISNTQVRRILKKEGVVFRSLKTPDEVGSSFSSSKKSDKIFNLFYSNRIHLNKFINFIYKDSTIYLSRKYDFEKRYKGKIFYLEKNLILKGA